MTLIVGLGNIGKKYSLNRHNIGFMIVDKILKSSSFIDVSSSKFQGELYKNSSLLLLKPHTYMNLSGESVLSVKNFYNIDLEKIVVLHDDLELPLGTIRFKRGGGHGGHNGLRSIDEKIGNNYYRLRFGIGRPEFKSEVSSYVLSDFYESENKLVNQLIEHSEKASLEFLTKSLNEITSKYTLKASVI